jgi:predicted PurR-regulated permease PerM
MGQDRHRDRLQGTELAARRFVLALLIGSALLVGAVAWPLASALLIAAVLGIVLAPLQERLARTP